LENFNDERIKYFYSELKFPLYKARNEAIKKSSGSLIAFLDVDDWWDKEYLSSKKKFLEDSNYDFFYSNTIIYNEKNKTYKKYKKFIFPDGKIYEYLAKDYFIIISGLIIKKAILQKENYFNEKYNIIGDFDLLMRISKYANAKGFNEPLIYYRIHKSNFSKLNNKMFFEEYKNWFDKQSQIINDNFEKNKNYFLLELKRLEIIYFLYEGKSLTLLYKILKIPKLTLKIKFLITFFFPIKLIEYFRK
jgi:glycosyltransferase involved in cell wall biosynthesis